MTSPSCILEEAALQRPAYVYTHIHTRQTPVKTVTDQDSTLRKNSVLVPKEVFAAAQAPLPGESGSPRHVASAATMTKTRSLLQGIIVRT